MRRIWKTLLCAVLLLFLCLGSVGESVLAATSQDAQVKAYQQSIKDLEKTQKDLKSKLSNVQSKLYSAQKQLDDLKSLMDTTNARIRVTGDLIDALDRQITEKEAQIAEKEAQIAEKETAAEKTHTTFLMLIRAQYENGTPSALEVLLDASSLSDMLTRLEYVGSVLKYADNLHTRYLAEKDELTAMREALVADKDALVADRTSQEEYRASLESEKRELSVQEGQYEVLAASLKQSEKEILDEYNKAQSELKKENERLEKLLADIAKQNKTAYTGGKLDWPVPTSVTYISSYYGYRTYYYKGKKVSNFHTAIDIAAPTGTDIYAAADGEVVVATSHYSYGNYIIVDHGVDSSGRGISTLYAHCSKLLVKVGDKVKRGDHIAEMGMTGSATGPHVHFEVRINGKHTNPLDGWVVQPK